jgi:cytochrome c553
MRSLVLAASLLAILASSAPAAAGPIDTPGFTKAFACSACHGRAGASKSDVVPVLAGMPA